MPPRPSLPKLRGLDKPYWTRGPKKLQGSLLAAQRQVAHPPAPGGWVGTLPEWCIYWAHLELGMEPGVDFSYQSSQEGGRTEYGGQVLDFIEYQQPLAINIQGLYWHYNRGAEQLSRDQNDRVRLANYGLQLVFIDEDNALNAPVYFLKEALLGIDHSRARPGS